MDVELLYSYLISKSKYLYLNRLDITYTQKINIQTDMQIKIFAVLEQVM